MNKWKKIIKNWNRELKFAIYNSKNYQEIFGFSTTKIRIISLILVFIILTSLLLIYLLSLTPFGQSFYTSLSNHNKTELIVQRKRVDSLARIINNQNQYIENFKRVFTGDFQEDTIQLKNANAHINLDSINSQPSEAEKIINQEVKSDQFTLRKMNAQFMHFYTPLKGVVSQTYSKDHQAVDIVAPKNSYFSACLSGVVIYSDFSLQDGNILIIKHSGNYISIYKHAKSILKSRGDKVRIGDVLGIVGNTGTSSTGPHLHFELWHNQQVVNPENYMHF